MELSFSVNWFNVLAAATVTSALEATNQGKATMDLISLQFLVFSFQQSTEN
jgi:hypothetical protein